MNVTVLHDAVAADAAADDRDVLEQAAAVGHALRARGHAVSVRPVDLDLAALAAEFERARPDCVVNLVESLAGDDRGILHIPALLEALDVPFTGASLSSVLMTTNKPLGKRLLRDAGLPTPPWYAAGDPTAAAAALLGERVIVKPSWDHGSKGLDAADVRTFDRADALEAAVAEGRFVELYIDGREFNLALLADGRGGVDLLPPAEMLFLDWDPAAPRVVGYRAKWVSDSFEYRHTVRRFDYPAADAALLARLEDLARSAWRCCGLRGYARVDFRVDERTGPLILEVNVNPCLSPGAGFSAALERAGVPFERAIERILADAPGLREGCQR